MSFIYTHNTSPRRFKRVVKNKSYYEAVEKQNKLLRSIGIDPHRTIRRDSFKVMPLEQVGKLQTFSNHKNVEEKLWKSVNPELFKKAPNVNMLIPNPITGVPIEYKMPLLIYCGTTN